MSILYPQEDITKYKYVIYARKSSEESDRQLRSLDDQIKECKQLATRLGLKVVGVIKEAKSAKKPNKRPEFSQLLKKLQSGKIHGVISWAPDRLARNMLEAGMIIDMIDEGIIKDLKFATYPFSKDANGLMLLGMSFVLSKQYSDKLSQDVTRGLYSSLAEGKASGITKHGYNIDKDGYFVPNDMWELLYTAWEKRMLGEGLVSISKWLNDNGYAKKYRASKRVVKMTKQKLSLIFNDTFYYGLLKVRQTTIDLREIPETAFVPMITEEEFKRTLNIVRDGKVNYLRQKSKFGLLPLHNIVRCSECGNACNPYPSKGKGGDRYLYYTCRTADCSRFNEGTRGKVIFDWLYDFLKDGFNVTKKDYEELLAKRKKNIGTIKNSLEAEIRQQEIRIKTHNEAIDKISMQLVSTESEVAKKSLEKQVDKKSEELADMEAELEKKKQHRRELGSVDITWDKFVNITKNLSKILKSGDKYQKDAIVRIIFVNIFVNRENVLKYNLKEPFQALLNRNSNAVVLSGRGAGNRTRATRPPASRTTTILRPGES